MSKLVIYLATPITRGNRTWNFYQSCEAQKILMQQGHAVIAPGLSMLHPDAWNISHEDWLANCLPILEKCDWVIRLPGESIGADIETRHARRKGIPVCEVHDLSVLERIEHVKADRNGEDTSSTRRQPGGSELPYSPQYAIID